MGRDLGVVLSPFAEISYQQIRRLRLPLHRCFVEDPLLNGWRWRAGRFHGTLLAAQDDGSRLTFSDLDVAPAEIVSGKVLLIINVGQLLPQRRGRSLGNDGIET